MASNVRISAALGLTPVEAFAGLVESRLAAAEQLQVRNQSVLGSTSLPDRSVKAWSGMFTE